MQMVADKCHKCGRIVVKHDHIDSSDMVKTNDSFLYICDIKLGESSRPCLQLKEYYGADEARMYCLDCLLEVVVDWVKEMKKRGASKIPLNHIIAGDKVLSRCPICGK